MGPVVLRFADFLGAKGAGDLGGLGTAGLAEDRQ
jgi:hypothetical protein